MERPTLWENASQSRHIPPTTLSFVVADESAFTRTIIGYFCFSFPFFFLFPKHANTDCAYDERLYASVGRTLELACEENGNYMPLQSRNGELFCVDPDGFIVAQNVPSQANCNEYIFGANV
ncbi:AGAP005942-PA-like protein [Anopheles sinensis]|uniref:AGAP005942-PA-like protein n=1 Tax=Anopheles sinensis TaxID=74873 RepID=A0A084WA95_ANOSI|nr:AGAP005942-PA-like protein [Anopheles sinensis]